MINPGTKPIHVSRIVVTEPAVEPFTVDELKLFARIDGASEDGLLTGFIKATRLATEDYLGRALIQQTMKVVLDEWPGMILELPRPPLMSVSSINTIDEDDAETEYDSENYYVVTESIPGQIIIKQGSSAPVTYLRDVGGYEVLYIAGYGEAATDIPKAIVEGMKLWATAMYENRALTTDPPPQAKPLLNLYKVMRI